VNMSMAVESISRAGCYQQISELETKRLMHVSIEHFALPIIGGMSMDLVSQEMFEQLGGKGPKPQPFGEVKKLNFYRQIETCLKPILNQLATQLIQSVLKPSLDPLTDEQLQIQLTQLKEKIKGDSKPDWNKLGPLFNDHLYSFNQLKKESVLKLDIKKFHDELCQLMAKHRDNILQTI
jgi:hypothetical protein